MVHPGSYKALLERLYVGLVTVSVYYEASDSYPTDTEHLKILTAANGTVLFGYFNAKDYA